jgi:hypothetical protein
VVRVIDGDTVVLNLDLGWHTWRHNESVRLAHVNAPERGERARWAEAKAFVERLLPAGTEVLLISEKLEKYGRTLGRIVLRDGRDIGAELLTVRRAWRCPTRRGEGRGARGDSEVGGAAGRSEADQGRRSTGRKCGRGRRTSWTVAGQVVGEAGPGLWVRVKRVLLPMAKRCCNTKSRCTSFGGSW